MRVRLIDHLLGTDLTFAESVLTRIKEKLDYFRDQAIRATPTMKIEEWKIEKWLIEELRFCGRSVGAIEFLELANDLEDLNGALPSGQLSFEDAIQFWLEDSDVG